MSAALSKPAMLPVCTFKRVLKGCAIEQALGQMQVLLLGGPADGQTTPFKGKELTWRRFSLGESVPSFGFPRGVQHIDHYYRRTGALTAVYVGARLSQETT